MVYIRMNINHLSLKTQILKRTISEGLLFSIHIYIITVAKTHTPWMDWHSAGEKKQADRIKKASTVILNASSVDLMDVLLPHFTSNIRAHEYLASS